MTPFKCYDILEQVMDDVTDELSADWLVIDKELDRVKKFCEGIDDLLDRFGGVGLTAEVDHNMMIHITVESDDIVIHKGEHDIYELMDYCQEMRFYPSDDNNLCVEYVMRGIWFQTMR